MSCRLSAVFPLILALGMPDRARETERTFYSITINGDLVGYAEVASEAAKHDGSDVIKQSCKTSLKVALLGKPHQVVLDSTTWARPETFVPVRYELRSKTNDVEQAVECEFKGGVARLSAYRPGEPKGAPSEIKLPADALLLGGNHFGHWQWITATVLKSAKSDRIRVPVFIPDTRQSQTFEFVRDEPREIEVSGKPVKCSVWQVKAAGITVFINAVTNQFVRMDVPAQRTTIALADETVAQRVATVRPKEALAEHFTQSNVAFDDYLRITELKADLDVDVIGSGVGNPVGALQTPMQKFEGTKDGARVKGSVAIKSIRYEGKDSPAFSGDKPMERTEWLKPSEYIESDYAEIVALSRELTKGAPTRWEATRRIAQWVHKEIRYAIADTPSARLALEKKQGDCGPHSTLAVALLRAAGIPSRLVGGLVYSPTFGGTFGQHAWIEVDMGPAGWVPLDPTTGEFESLSATHLKLFEELGGVIPKSVKVIAFEPPNRALATTTPAQPKPLPWKLDKEHSFRFVQDGKEIGREVFSIAKVKQDNQDAYRLKSRIDLKTAMVTLKSDAVIVTTTRSLPLSFHRELEAAGQKYTFDCNFRGDTVAAKISGAKELARDIKIPEGTYCFDNNLMASWVLICSPLDLATGKKVDVRAFHPSSLQVLTLTFEPSPLPSELIGTKKIECYRCEIPALKNTFWITRDGRFVKAQQGTLVVELAEIDD